ncbi:glutamate racemase [Candidatus Kaiserbacteria bacterium]|nr:MAG: glutamate racemase [Candidatus Kaiserbacteria bacterium]
MKIGFFDSGMGGLTILRAVRAYMPEYDYIFFGDTANVPYGSKSEEEIHTLTYAGIKRLFDAGAVIVIVACNTASARSVRIHQDEMLAREYPDRKLLGVIIPTVETLLATPAKNVLLIGTERTIRSEKYLIELKKGDADFTLYTHATPSLVPLIESGDLEGACTEVRHVLCEPKYANIDTVVLGCTHYTLLKECIRCNRTCTIISQDEIIPEKFKEYLTRHPEIESRLTREGSVEIDLSVENEHYDTIKKTLLRAH